ncbi:glycoprotein precursor [Dante Muikkunen virus 1]|uniref:Glycoprotein n=1 Tax=Dante Muikkunen virus 1 TaxID=2447916 RepID=A0A3Q8Q2G6_9VIRU|nr:glycoprotein precursor [Dante Muikkunen virus 1]AZI72577.1 glycoprotein precursor [Dante Muikkunen virus 1]
MGALQSISETFVAVVQHMPLIVFLVVFVWFLLMCLRGRWWKVAYLLVLTPKCQSYTFCSGNEFNLCTTVQSTIESKYHIIRVQNQSVITKLLIDSYYFNILTLSNCSGNNDFELISRQIVNLNKSETMGCNGGWRDNNYYDTYNCRNSSTPVNLVYHGPFKSGNSTIGFWTSTKSVSKALETVQLTNLTFKWKHHDYSKHVFDLSQNLTKVECNQQKHNCSIRQSSSGSNYTKCQVLPMSVLKRTKRESSVSLTTTTSVFSLVALDTGYSDSSALWESIIRTQTALEKLELIVANISKNQAIIAGEINIDQTTIKDILIDMKNHGLKLNKAEKFLNNSHLCIMRNEEKDLTHYVRVNHTYTGGSHNHNCKNLILINDSLSGLIHMTHKAHLDAIQSLRMNLLRSYLLTFRWEYPTSIFLVFLGFFFLFFQKRAEMHRHYKKGEEWKCPYPHYPNKKGLCSCGKEFSQTKLIECPIEKH